MIELQATLGQLVAAANAVCTLAPPPAHLQRVLRRAMNRAHLCLVESRWRLFAATVAKVPAGSRIDTAA